MDEFGRIYDAVLENDVATLFAQLIGVVLVVAVLGRFMQRLVAFDRHGATLLTTLGVLGTFVGIFLGLLDFDVADIDASVPALLEGLKVAFSTSILGMAAAIALRIFQGVVPQRVQGTGDVTPETIHGALTDIETSVTQAAARQTEALESVRNAISADSDSSLLTQMQKIRISVEDGNRDMIREFRSFAEQMAENNTKALIDALERVIRDFNAQLNEQFGENFKQLNHAVGALLEWQENYKGHVEETEKRIKTAVEALQSSELALREIAGHTKQIPAALADLQELLNGFKAATDDLGGHLEAVAGLKDRALDAFPTIEKNITMLTDDFSASIRKGIEANENVLREQHQSFTTMSEGFEKLREGSESAQSLFHSALEAAMSEVQNQLERSLESHSGAIEASAETMQHQLQEAWRTTQEAINTQFETFDQHMQQELTRTIQLMGRHLASLSEKFVTDYGPLSDGLSKLVQAMRRAS